MNGAHSAQNHKFTLKHYQNIFEKKFNLILWYLRINFVDGVLHGNVERLDFLDRTLALVEPDAGQSHPHVTT